MKPHKELKLLFGAPAAVSISLLAAPAVHAQAFPTKPVRIVVARPPGGSNDVVARVLPSSLRTRWGRHS